MPPQGIPKLSELPLNEDDPPHSAWGLYGKDDELGTLNRLTDEVVADAAKEIKTGKRINLDCALDAQGDTPLFQRPPFSKEIMHKAPRIVNDDVWTFNTQISSQWDGLRHFANQKYQRFYNGVTLDEIHTPGNTRIGIQAFSKHGIIGRGILLDYHGWCMDNCIPHESWTGQAIPFEHLQEVAKAQGTEIHFGDILLTRTGFKAEYIVTDRQKISDMSQRRPPTLIGVEQSEKVVEWIWNNFSAVGGDQPGFECFPSRQDYMLHEILLAGWGCPIGENLDLEELAEHCRATKRWSFFLSSKPCNVPGGVASPPNIMAIF